MKHYALKFQRVTLVFVLLFLSYTTQAKVVSFNKNTDGISFTLDNGLMKVKICADNMVEVKYTELPVFMDKASLVITNEWKTTPDFTVAENATEVTITTAKLNIVVNKLSNSVKYTDLKGNVILSEDDSQSKSMKEATIAGIDTYICSSKFKSPKDESLYGLGCHPEDSLSVNYKCRNQEMAIKY